MDIQYDVFHPANSGIKFPLPCEVTLLLPDGRQQVYKVKTNVAYNCLPPYAAFKVHKPVDPMQELREDLYKQGFVSRYDAKRILTYLDNRGLLKVDGQPSAKVDWLDEKMDELGINYPNSRRNVRNWFEDPENYPEVNLSINNGILTVKPSGGGRVVVLPTGHTIAYTLARDVYNEMRGLGSLYHGGLNGRRVSVGEYCKGNISHHKYALHIRKDDVTVGCQAVPKQAILDLAKREGW